MIASLIQANSALPSLTTALTAGWDGAAVLLISAVSGFLYALASLLAIAFVDLACMSLSTVCLVSIEMVLGVPLLLLEEGIGTSAHLALSLAGIAAVLAAVAFDYLCHARLAKDLGHDGVGQASSLVQ